MTDFQEIAERYIAIWNETDPSARRPAIDALWARDGRYVDPLVEVQGREEINTTVGAVQAQFPEFDFRLAGTVDGHHDQCRFSWELGPRGEEAPVVGSDVVLVDADGAITAVLGFLDRVPAT